MRRRVPVTLLSPLLRFCKQLHFLIQIKPLECHKGTQLAAIHSHCFLCSTAKALTLTCQSLKLIRLSTQASREVWRIWGATLTSQLAHFHSGADVGRQLFAEPFDFSEKWRPFQFFPLIWLYSIKCSGAEDMVQLVKGLPCKQWGARIVLQNPHKQICNPRAGEVETEISNQPG